MLKISYCSTCMNRGHQLNQTLEKNLKIIADLQGEAELCLVNFIKDQEGEEIHEWVKSLGAKPYFRYAVSRELKHWHAPTAKNTAHLLGQGDFLVNLDCDNFISPVSARKLIELTDEQRSHLVFSGFTGNFEHKKLKVKDKSLIKKAKALAAMKLEYRDLKPKKTRIELKSVRIGPDGDFNGTYGHIGMPKNIFLMMGGYDESFPPMGGQDKDVLWRAFNFEGMELFHVPQSRDCLPILNDKTESLKHTNVSGSDWEIIASEAGKRCREAIRRRHLIVNKNRHIGVQTEVVFG